MVDMDRGEGAGWGGVTGREVWQLMTGGEKEGGDSSEQGATGLK